MALFSMQTEKQRQFTILYVDDWDFSLDEPRGGGRVVAVHDDAAEVMRAYHDYLRSAARQWGDGHLVITDAEGHLVYARGHIGRTLSERLAKLRYAPGDHN